MSFLPQLKKMRFDQKRLCIKSFSPKKDEILHYNLFCDTHELEHLTLLRLPDNNVGIYDNNNYFYDCIQYCKMILLKIRKRNENNVSKK